MFCCAVCNVMYTGVYPESVSATSCGHVFHTSCILMCLNKYPKCPFCTLHVEKSRLIKLHFQINSNWKAIAASLKDNANSSIVNLDETFNDSLRIEDSDSIVTVPDVYPFLDETYNDSLRIENSGSIDSVTDLLINGDNQSPVIISTRTLITTSLSGYVLSPKMKNLLLIFNDILPNSEIKKRLLISESNLLQTATEEGFTNIIIVNMSLGNPIGLSLIDLLANLKTHVMLLSFNCLDYEQISQKIKNPPFTTFNTENLNDNQQFIVHFFSKISNSNTGRKINMEEVHITRCKTSQTIEFTYSLVGLRFYMVSPGITNIERITIIK